MEEQKDVLILAIESSCDETAAAVGKNGRTILSNIINSQIAIHTEYGGVVPEIASRKHIENINPVIRMALDEAGVTLDVCSITSPYRTTAPLHGTPRLSRRSPHWRTARRRWARI